MQAELSILIEEGRALRPPPVKAEEIPTALVEDFSSKPQSVSPTSLSHAHPFAYQLDIHPGQRIRGFTDAFEELLDKEAVDFKNPFPEPSVAQLSEIEQRAAVFTRLHRYQC